MKKLAILISILAISLSLQAKPKPAPIIGLGGMGIALVILPVNPPLAFVVGISSMAVGILIDQKDVKKKRNNK